jgi:hypothetical protein
MKNICCVVFGRQKSGYFSTHNTIEIDLAQKQKRRCNCGLTVLLERFLIERNI